MTPKITVPILEGSYEVVSAQVALILSAELANQVALQPTVDLEFSNVFYLRAVPVNLSEGTVVNVMYAQSNYESQTQRDTKSDISVLIDVYSRVYQGVGDSQTNDQLSRLKCNRLLEIIRAILESNEYKRLGFEDKRFIERVHVQSVQVEDPANRKDESGAVMGRLNLSVKANDGQVPQGSIDLNELFVTRELDSSGDELFIEYNTSS